MSYYLSRALEDFHGYLISLISAYPPHLPCVSMLRVISRDILRRNSLYPGATYNSIKITLHKTHPHPRKFTMAAARTETTEFSTPHHPGLMNFPQWSGNATQTLAELIQDNHEKVWSDTKSYPQVFFRFGVGGGRGLTLLTSIIFISMMINVM